MFPSRVTRSHAFILFSAVRSSRARWRYSMCCVLRNLMAILVVFFLYDVGRMWWWHFMSKSDTAWCESGEDFISRFSDGSKCNEWMLQSCSVRRHATWSWCWWRTVKSVRDSQLFTFEFFLIILKVSCILCVFNFSCFYHLILFLVVT